MPVPWGGVCVSGVHRGFPVPSCWQWAAAGNTTVSLPLCYEALCQHGIRTGFRSWLLQRVLKFSCGLP